MRKAILVFGLFLASAQAQEKTFDKQFKTWMAVDWSANAYDFATTKWRDAGTKCVESNPLMGPHPSTGREVLVMGGFTVGSQLASYALKKKHFRLWWVPMAWDTGVHGYYGTGNIVKCR